MRLRPRVSQHLELRMQTQLVRFALELMDARCFDNTVTYLRNLTICIGCQDHSSDLQSC
jgi:hypothetical protein